jgi:hypothetical protein
VAPLCLESIPGVERPEHEVNDSLRSSAAVRDEWSRTSAPTICLRGLERDNFLLFMRVEKI